jgi:hypothetical protein
VAPEQVFLQALRFPPSGSFSKLTSIFKGTRIKRANVRSLGPPNETDFFFLKMAELRNKMTIGSQVQARSPSGLMASSEVADGTSTTIREAAVQSLIPVPTVQRVFICSYCQTGNNEFLHSIYAHSFHLTSPGKALISERKQ